MKLHVISFDVPWPADYGGVIDVYNRLEALHQSGVEITLHAFDYGRGEAHALNKICKNVHYYKRKNRLTGMLKKDPMIVATRSSEELLNNILQDQNPILFEGQHTTAIINHPGLINRKKLVRIHNVEHEYYAGLAATLKMGLKAAYFKKEAKKLKKHESILTHADQLMCITKKDQAYYNEKFANASYLPPAVSCNEGPLDSRRDIILYHGNLGVPENHNAVKWLLKNVCPGVDHTFVFAGKSPNQELQESISVQSNATLIADLSDDEMKQLIHAARAHVMYTNQSTGIKIKLLNALCTRSPIVCNAKMVEGTGLEGTCNVVQSPREFQEKLNEVMASATSSGADERKRLLASFSYESHASILRSFLE